MLIQNLFPANYLSVLGTTPSSSLNHHDGDKERQLSWEGVFVRGWQRAFSEKSPTLESDRYVFYNHKVAANFMDSVLRPGLNDEKL